MDLSQLQLKLEELDIDQSKIEEVMSAAEAWQEAGEAKANIPLDNLVLMREIQTDWRKRAIISAEIIKRGLDV